MVDSQKLENKTDFLTFVKAAVVSVIITLALILAFAFVLKLTALSDSVITPVNLVIKAFSVVIGTLILTKNRQKGLIKGLGLGAAFTVLSFAIFSILNGAFVFNFGLFTDLAFNCVVGAITGVIRNRG